MNISGPVRAIRSYLGANSYKWTVNTDFFYPNRQDTVTELRGHAGLPGYGSADDYIDRDDRPDLLRPGQLGRPDRRHRRHRHPDRLHDRRAPSPVAWQMVTGAAGFGRDRAQLETDITGLNVTTVYQDRNPASPAQCTGDAAAWGQNGQNVTSPVNNVPVTDPTLTSTPATFVTHRFRYFEAPNLTATAAGTIDLQARTPLTTVVTG